MPDEPITLQGLQKRAAHLRKAGDRLDKAWTPVRNLVTRASLVVALPAAGILAHWASFQTGQIGAAVTGITVVVGVPLLANRIVRAVQEAVKHSSASDRICLRLLAKAVELGSLPTEISGPLDRALDAYFAMRRIGEDPVWKRAGLPMRESIAQAGERLLELLDWGRRLKFIGDRLSRVQAETNPEHQETLRHFRSQCEQLGRAAGVFTQAEAKMTRAYAAISADHTLGSAAAAQFRDVTATFDALTEVLNAGEQSPEPISLPQTPQAAESEAQILLGVPRSSS